MSVMQVIGYDKCVVRQAVGIEVGRELGEWDNVIALGSAVSNVIKVRKEDCDV